MYWEWISLYHRCAFPSFASHDFLSVSIRIFLRQIMHPFPSMPGAWRCYVVSNNTLFLIMSKGEVCITSHNPLWRSMVYRRIMTAASLWSLQKPWWNSKYLSTMFFFSYMSIHFKCYARIHDNIFAYLQKMGGKEDLIGTYTFGRYNLAGKRIRQQIFFLSEFQS